MAGKIVADTLEHSTAGSVDTQYVVNGSAKAWVNLDGTGTIAVSDSLNVASATDDGTGEYTITFSNSMANSTYCLSGGTTPGSGAYTVLGFTTLATGSYKIFTSDGSTSQEDKDPAMGSLHGDLA